MIYCILEKGAKSCLFKQICILEGVLEMEQNKVDTNESNTTDKKTKLISKIKDLKDLPKGEGTTKKLPRIYTYFLYFLIFYCIVKLLAYKHLHINFTIFWTAYYSYSSIVIIIT